jgi:glycosyltransferase involved in cell wall biosynthesis
MNILFVNHNGFSSNSAVHVMNLANAIAELGADVAVAVPEGDDTQPAGAVRFKPITYQAAMGLRYQGGQGPDFIHAWTPRQHVARITRALSSAHGCPYIVHLEDNEHAITAANLGLSVAQLRALAAAQPHFAVPDHLAQPQDMQAFLNGSVGVTVLMDRLLEFKPPALPGVVIWPAAENELFYPRTADLALRAQLGIPKHAKVLVYHGNVHLANVGEVRSLYLAIGALERQGVDIVLVRLGADDVPVLPPEMGSIARLVIKVPFQPREQISRYLALADVLVQPGRVDDFNAYRFPSKLPEFFAMGRPVILPATNVGLVLQQDEEGLLLRRGDALETAMAIKRVLEDRQLSDRTAAGGRRFYERMLDWKKSGSSLMRFYGGLPARPRFDDLSNDTALRRVAKHYADFRPSEVLSYATVRDYSNGVESLNALATINQDLKDAQRPWVFKAILGSVPTGGRLLEIGAGDPWVADLLTRLGYEVVVVDPYDGRDRGPAQFEQIKTQFPRITFLRGLFPQALSVLEDEKFDCIYSISVLEHLPMDSVQSVFTGIAAHSRTATSPTIHAIDHVLLGDGAESHYLRLKKMVECLGLVERDLQHLLNRLDRDPDAYFLSAEAHNRWRGATPYEDFPMRRCVSIQVFSPGMTTAGLLEVSP